MSKVSMFDMADGHRFYSKRNSVTYMKSSDCVRKEFFDRKAFENELYVYGCLKEENGVPAGKVVFVDSKALVIHIKYLRGPTLLDLLDAAEEEADISRGVQLLKKALAWLEAFYCSGKSELVLNDVNLRNFIMVDDQLYGLDFEMAGEGDRTKEKAMVLAMYLMYEPTDTGYKTSVVQGVLQSRRKDRQKISSLMRICRQEILERRRKKR